MARGALLGRSCPPSMAFWNTLICSRRLATSCSSLHLSAARTAFSALACWSACVSTSTCSCHTSAFACSQLERYSLSYNAESGMALKWVHTRCMLHGELV